MIEPHRHTFAMGCAFLALILIGMYLIATPSRSQETPGQAICMPAADLQESLGKQFSETVAAGGVVGEQGYVFITENPETHSFTIIFRKPNGIACIVMGGTGFALADPIKNKGKPL